ncbi:MAG: hypothetical protein ACR2JO_09865 [Mycobacteriales bacterium]
MTTDAMRSGQSRGLEYFQDDREEDAMTDNDQVLRELRALRQEVAALRDDNSRLRVGAAARGTERGPGEAPGAVSRRQLLVRAGAVAAGGLGLSAAGSLMAARPAAASTGTMQYGTQNDAGADLTNLVSSSNAWTLLAQNTGTGPGVYGDGTGGPGLFGESIDSNAVMGRIQKSSNPFNALYGTTVGSGSGVFGESNSTSLSTGTGNGVLGIARGKGNSVYGYKPAGTPGDAVVGFAASGRGVFGLSTSGRGLVGQGKPAQLQLVASPALAHPTNGLRGDFFVDKSGRLWFCKGGTSWKQLA